MQVSASFAGPVIMAQYVAQPQATASWPRRCIAVSRRPSVIVAATPNSGTGKSKGFGSKRQQTTAPGESGPDAAARKTGSQFKERGGQQPGQGADQSSALAKAREALSAKSGGAQQPAGISVRARIMSSCALANIFSHAGVSVLRRQARMKASLAVKTTPHSRRCLATPRSRLV